MFDQLLSFYLKDFTFSKLNLQRLFLLILLISGWLATTRAVNTVGGYNYGNLGNYAFMGLGACLLAGFAMLALAIVSR